MPDENTELEITVTETVSQGEPEVEPSPEVVVTETPKAPEIAPVSQRIMDIANELAVNAGSNRRVGRAIDLLREAANWC